jgi:hypothetical protein
MGYSKVTVTILVDEEEAESVLQEMDNVLEKLKSRMDPFVAYVVETTVEPTQPPAILE